MQWLYRTLPDENGERFAAKQTRNSKNTENIINFWHITPKHTYLFTIKPNKMYNRKVFWSEGLCHQLVKELRAPKPETTVVRYVVDGQQIFSDLKGTDFPKTPAAPEGPPSPPVRRKPKKKRPEIEAEKCQQPAPFILYGKHIVGGAKEYSWRLTPDKPKRQGIVPGDTVLVWTQSGFRQVVVTRIEEAGDKEQPAARVKKKL